MTVCSPGHPARGPTSVTRVLLQSTVSSLVHAARGPRSAMFVHVQVNAWVVEGQPSRLTRDVPSPLQSSTLMPGQKAGSNVDRLARMPDTLPWADRPTGASELTSVVQSIGVAGLMGAAGTTSPSSSPDGRLTAGLHLWLRPAAAITAAASGPAAAATSGTAAAVAAVSCVVQASMVRRRQRQLRRSPALSFTLDTVSVSRSDGRRLREGGVDGFPVAPSSICLTHCTSSRKATRQARVLG